jgi:hypothetical protein
VYTKNIQIRDNDNISFFENFKLDDAGVHGAGTKYDGKKLYIFLLNTGESDVNVKRGEYLGNILLEEIISRE